MGKFTSRIQYAGEPAKRDINGTETGLDVMHRILMRDIQNNEIIEERINCLFEQVRNLSVPELGEARITISVGVAISPKDGNTFMELYRHADKALYKVKSEGRNNYQRYKKM